MIPAWADQYVGIPFVDLGRTLAGVDCWGLARLALERELGIRDLPDYSDRYLSARDRAVAGIFHSDLSRDWVRVEQPRLGDIAVFRVAGQPRHVGLVLAPGWMLSIERGVNSAVQRIDGSHWTGRLEGYYRHARSHTG